MPTWEEVLAAVEADAAHSAGLLTVPAEELVAVPPPPLLPALGAMPPVPEYLRERVVALQERIRALENELAATLRDWPQPVNRPPAIVAPAAPRFVDCRM